MNPSVAGAILFSVVFVFCLLVAAVVSLWSDRETWAKRAKDAERLLSAERQAHWVTTHTPDGYRRRATDCPEWWVLAASDKRGMNWTAGQDAEGN